MYFGEGNGNSLQGSCLENPRDGGAWWAAITGVAQSRTRLKWLSSSSSTMYFSLFKTEPVKLLPYGFPDGSDGKESACNVGDPSPVSGSGRSPGERHGNPLQYSCLEDPMDCNPLGFSVQKDSPGKDTGVGCHSLLREIFPTQESNLGLPHCRQILYHLSHQGSPIVL